MKNETKIAQPVSAFVKATVQDADYLEVLVPHILRQARFPFKEKFILIDERHQFTGKFRGRKTPSRHEFYAAVGRLVDSGVVDRVERVSYDSSSIQRVMNVYFRNRSEVPTHSTNGCPIYPTLFGLEASLNDLVIQYDADMLFHSIGGSWVVPALEVMGRDDSIWAMMTHAGPPAAPLGEKESLGPRNANAAQWDDALRIWRFKAISTRYFLCDRRKFRGRLTNQLSTCGCPPLETILSAALDHHNAFRGTVAMEGSWDLHAYNHESPFPDWAPTIVAAIEQGIFPPSQVGDYDLRLDCVAERRAWEVIVKNWI